MKSINFRKTQDIKTLPYSFKVLSKKEGEIIFPALMFASRLTGLQDPVDSDATFHVLTNGYAVKVTEYSYIIFPDQHDLENYINALKSGMKSKNNPINQFTKLLDIADPKERTLLKPDGKEIQYAQYSQKKGALFLKNRPPAERRPATFQSEKLSWNDGRTAHYHNNKHDYQLFIFKTNSDYAYYWSTFMKWYGDTRVWCGRNPYGENVLEYKDQLFDELALFLKLDREDIGFETGDHHKLHKAIRELIFVDYTTNQLFLPLVIYLGELQISLYGGEWIMEYNDKIESWVPKLKLGKLVYDIGHEVYHELLHPDDKKLPPLATVLRMNFHLRS